MAALSTHHSPPCFLSLFFSQSQSSPPPPLSPIYTANLPNLLHSPLRFDFSLLEHLRVVVFNFARKMKREIAMIIVAIAVVLGAAAAEAMQAEAPAVDCSTLVLGMADCLTFVTNGSTIEKPEGQCCSGLKAVLRTDAQCLCDAFKNSASFGVALNLTKALALPTACHVSAPSAKNCGVTLSPTGAPVASPAGAPESLDANAPASSGASEVSPSPTPGKNASPVLGVSLSSVVLCLAAAMFSSL